MAKFTRKTETATATERTGDMRNNIKAGQMYIIRERIFGNTNEEWAKMGRGKSPSLDGSDIIPARWHEMSKRYDLGLTPDSNDFSGMTDSEIEDVLESRKFVRKAFERTFGANFFTNSINNEESLGDKSASLMHERVLSTDKDSDVVELWIMLLSSTVCFKHELNEQKYYNNAIYTIESYNEKTNFEEEVQEDKMRLSQWFIATQATDRPKVVLYMNYISTAVNEKMSDGTLFRIFNEMLENVKDRAQLKDLILNKNEEKLDRLRISVILNTALVKGVIKEKNGSYSYNGEDIGFSRPNVISLLSNNQAVLAEVEKAIK
jgi:hypothetical protein